MKRKKQTKLFGTKQIAAICHVSAPTVARWIDQKKLKAAKTPGGHRRVWKEDLVVFLHEHQIPVPTELGQVSGLALILSDDGSVESLLRRLIEKRFPKVRIQVAKDPFGAGQAITRFVPDMVILDADARLIDGTKVCELVRLEKTFKSTKILVLGAPNDGKASGRWIQSGAHSFIPKPLNLERLVDEMAGLAA